MVYIILMVIFGIIILTHDKGSGDEGSKEYDDFIHCNGKLKGGVDDDEINEMKLYWRYSKDFYHVHGTYEGRTGCLRNNSPSHYGIFEEGDWLNGKWKNYKGDRNKMPAPLPEVSWEEFGKAMKGRD